MCVRVCVSLLQIDIPYSEHSHVIGKEGVNIKRGRTVNPETIQCCLLCICGLGLTLSDDPLTPSRDPLTSSFDHYTIM